MITGAAFASLAAVLAVLALPDSLPSCVSVRGNVDGTGGTACGTGLDWDAQSVAGVVVAAVCGLIPAICFALGLRGSRR